MMLWYLLLLLKLAVADHDLDIRDHGHASTLRDLFKSKEAAAVRARYYHSRSIVIQAAEEFPTYAYQIEYHFGNSDCEDSATLATTYRFGDCGDYGDGTMSYREICNDANGQILVEYNSTDCNPNTVVDIAIGIPPEELDVCSNGFITTCTDSLLFDFGLKNSPAIEIFFDNDNCDEPPDHIQVWQAKASCNIVFDSEEGANSDSYHSSACCDTFRSTWYNGDGTCTLDGFSFEYQMQQCISGNGTSHFGVCDASTIGVVDDDDGCATVTATGGDADADGSAALCDNCWKASTFAMIIALVANYRVVN